MESKKKTHIFSELLAWKEQRWSGGKEHKSGFIISAITGSSSGCSADRTCSSGHPRVSLPERGEAAPQDEEALRLSFE